MSCPVLSLVLQNVIAMNAGKVLYSSCAGKHGAQYKTNFITLKAVLSFQTLMLATLGKWATTHDRVIFLDKNCSWTSLPGWTWLQTPITCLYRSSSKLQNTFCFFKTCWRLTGYQGFMMPLNHQAGYKVLFKTTLNILVARALMHHISFLSVRMIYTLTLDRFTRHNTVQKICPRSRPVRNLCLNRYLSFWRM